MFQLWKGEDLTLLGVFRGHKRGVWCVQFSPVDQVSFTFGILHLVIYSTYDMGLLIQT